MIPISLSRYLKVVAICGHVACVICVVNSVRDILLSDALAADKSGRGFRELALCRLARSGGDRDTAR